jgi:glycosyltransferase involved in cell wall biosynthesis
MRLIFYAGQCLPVHAKTLEERPLGGTETALIRLAAALASRGHQVTVFTSHRNPPGGPHDNPLYLPHERVAEVRGCDVFVAVQDWRPVLFHIPAKKTWYWTGDSFDQYINFGIGEKRVHPRIDRFLAVTNWHARTLCEASGFPFEKAWVIPYGIQLSDFEGQEPRNRKRLMYSSSPSRGLQFVPALYTELKRKHPDLELHVFSGLSIYDTEQPFSGPDVGPYRQIVEVLRKLPGCTVHGNVLQKQLAREFMKSGLLFYPNSFLETACITAMESLAAGCPVVSSAAGALPETVQDGGLLVPGTPGTPQYSAAFLQAADQLLSNENLWREVSERARTRASNEFGWDHAADRFEALLAADLGGSK